MPSWLRLEKDGMEFIAFLNNLSCAHQFIGEKGVLLKDLCEAPDSWMKRFSFLGFNGVKNALVRYSKCDEAEQWFWLRDLDGRLDDVNAKFSSFHRLLVLKALEHNLSEEAFEAELREQATRLKACEEAEARALEKRKAKELAEAEAEAEARAREIEEEREEREQMYGRGK